MTDEYPYAVAIAENAALPGRFHRAFRSITHVCRAGVLHERVALPPR